MNALNGALAAIVTMNLPLSTFPSAVTWAFAVILGLEKNSSQKSSRFSPLTAIDAGARLSTHRHQGEQMRQWKTYHLGQRHGASQSDESPTTRRMSDVRGAMLVVVEEFFGIDDRPEEIFIALPPGHWRIERFPLIVGPGAVR